eukprot:6209234-Pleurochrysis_carterae.AAC.1
MLIQSLSVEQRCLLRELLSVQQERFLAARDLCKQLRAEHLTPKFNDGHGADPYYCMSQLAIASQTEPDLHADALSDLLAPFAKPSIGGDDLNSALWSIPQMASAVLGAAATFKNLRLLDFTNPFTATHKIQLQFDDMSWTRGHGCTRLIVRTQDVEHDYNSPLYSRDVLFYKNCDKLKGVSANFLIVGDDSIHCALRSTMHFNIRPLDI